MNQDTASSAEYKNVKRQVAYNVSISDILKKEYVKADGWEPNYILKGDKKISRVNVVGVFVSKTETPGMTSANIDDGTGIIPIRAFSDDKIIENADVGDIVLVVGRPRIYGEEKYIMPEIIKKIKDSRWVELRKLELKAEPEDRVEVESVKTDKFENSNSSKIYEMIKSLDGGSGVDVEEVIKNSGMKDADDIIKNLLKEGDVFEVRAGKVKVLE